MDISHPFSCLRFLAGTYRRGLLIGACSLYLQWSDIAVAQHGLSTFGPCIDHPLEFIPAGIALREGVGPARPEIAVLAQDRPAIHFFTVGAGARIMPSGSVQLPSPQRAIASADLFGDGESEFVTLSSDGSEVTILTKKGDGYEHKEIRLESKAQRLAIADINNDGRKDILVFGKSMTGVETLLGERRRTFRPGPLLFPEISVSDLRTIDLNGDGITDVILLNWLSNQLVLLYGISAGVFSEQVTIPLPGEPADLAYTVLSREHSIRIAVTLPAEREIALLDGFVAGEFVMIDSIACPGRPAGVQFALVNEDNLPDVVTATENGIAVAVALSGGDYAPPTLFGIGSPDRSWVVADVDGDTKADLVLTDRTSRRLVVAANADHAGKIEWPASYAVGSVPRGIALLDCNHDGRNDVAVVNAGSASLSMLMNQGGGKFLGQQSITLPDSPASITVGEEGSIRDRIVVTSHPSQDEIAVVHIAKDVIRSDMFSIPTSAHPYALYAKQAAAPPGLEVFVRSKNSRDGSLSISLFEQLSGKQFLERSLQANLPNRIAALTVGDFGGDGKYELVFATNDKRSRAASVFLATGSTEFDFKNVTELYTYPDSLACTRSIVSGFLDGDEHRDFMIVLGPPRNAFAIGYGQGNGRFRDSLVWIEDVHPDHDDEIVLRDINGDGRVDVAYLDRDRQALMVLYGTGRRRFAPAVDVCPAAGVSSFAIGPLKGSSTEDLVLSHPEKGTISILFDPFRR